MISDFGFSRARPLGAPLFGVQALACLAVALTWSAVAFCGEIHDAAKAGDFEKIKVLLKANPELVNAKDKEGWTPLHYSALTNGRMIQDFWAEQRRQRQYVEIAKFLLDSGADPKAKSNNGETPLHIAWFADMAEALLAKGADVNAKDKTGRTPLHGVADKWSWWKIDTLIDLLVAKGADVNAKDNDGKTPLRVAIEREKKNIADILRKHGAKE
jgi:ankyrin repeat protein